MDEYISKQDAVDAGYLSDWYISSVGDEPPIWTDGHIDELLNDFLVIPKDTPVADVQPVKPAHWYINPDGYYPQRSNCGYEPPRELIRRNGDALIFPRYCPECGADTKRKVK